MTDWLNVNVMMPDVLANIDFSEEEIERGLNKVAKLNIQAKSTPKWADVFSETLAKADADSGEDRVNRQILLLAYCSLLAKHSNPMGNHDRWLFAFTAKGHSPTEWYIRALKALEVNH
jgi:hypothetical protein